MDIIEEIQKAIKEIYKSEKIEVLSGMNKEYLLPNGKQLLVWNSKTISDIYLYQRDKGIDLNPNNFQFQKNLDNLLFNSDEVAYFTANAFLYKDKISNPIENAHSYFDDKDKKWMKYYPNFPNLASKRYSMYVAAAFEKIYNYWDRLGDLLWATYFQDKLKEKNVDFARVIDLIKINYPEYQNFESYKWLLDFKDEKQKKINDIRRNIVHYTSIDVEFKSKHLGQFENEEGKMQNVLSDKNQIERLMDERIAYADILKNEIINTIEGFIQIHNLIECITTFKKNQIQI